MIPALEGMASGLLAQMAGVSAQATAVGALLLLVERALPRASSALRSGLVLLALAKFATPAWLAWPLLPATGASGAAPFGTGSAAPAAGLLALVAFGSLCALLRVALLRVRLARRVAEARPCADPEVLAALRRAAERAGLRTLPPLLLGAGESEPFAVGVVRPRIVLPASWIGRLSLPDLETVLLHEAIHVRRRDVLRLELAALLGALWWWNPVCRWAVARWRLLIEEACDEGVLAAGRTDAAGYCGALLRAARLAAGARRPEPAGAAGIGVEDLERRLRRIVTGGVAAPRRPAAAAAALLVVALPLLPHLGPARVHDRPGPTRAARNRDAHPHAYPHAHSSHDHSAHGDLGPGAGRDVHVHTFTTGP